jgi:hypothetical protein
MASFLAGSVSLAAMVAHVGDAKACGGLFCSSANPVNQVAERIIFAQNDDDTITAAIEIQYKGPARQFAWVLPVPPGEVTVGVSSKQALDALQTASNPQYTLQTTFDSCGSEGDDANFLAGASRGDPQLAAESADEGPPVEVLSSGAVGPYDWVIIEVDQELADRADVAVEWLEMNGFDISGIGPEVLRIYLEQDMNLLAFRLSKGSDAGSIRPVLLTYPGERPVIPIQPTAVAAQDDMGILVWVLGEGRAIPTNYLSLELNEARIDWLNPAATYNDVVVAAADEAGGWGFVTEQSGPAGQFVENVYPTYKRSEWGAVRDNAFGSMQEFLQQVSYFAQAPFNPFSNGGVEYYDGFLDVMSDPDVVPLREGATPEQFIACIDCYFQTSVAVENDAYPPTPYVPGEDPIDQMDVPAFLDAFEDAVVKPLVETSGLFRDHPRVTRLYTTLSPDEMTIDPEFDVNTELGDVSNVHTAEQVVHCDGRWTIRVPQGHAIVGSGAWPIALTDDLPFNARALQLSTSGNGDVLIDNGEAISSGLEELGVAAQPRSDEGCAVHTTGRPSGDWLSFVAAALVWVFRRRQRDV